jgi:uncharacterized membrane protein YfcA
MEVIVVFLVVLLGSSIGTLTGFGLSTVMIPVMVLFYPLAEALLFVGIIHWFGDVWKLLLFREGIRWKLILSFGIPGILAPSPGRRWSFASPALSCHACLARSWCSTCSFLSFTVPFRSGPVW